MAPLYGLLVLAPNRAERAQSFVARVRARAAELGLADEHLAIADPATFHPDEIKGPTAAIYFGGPATDPLATELAASFVREGRPILPVVLDPGQTLKDYLEHVPSALAGVNGFADDESEAKLDQMVNILFEGLGLIRERRRLFISYRRKESNGVAHQLAAELHAAGYTVFLDTQSIDRGKLVSPALWNALADTDLVLFLDTSTALDSRWVADEFALANELGLTILHLVWPGRERIREAELSQALRLDTADFLSASAGRRQGKLRKSALTRILETVELLRARAFAMRRKRLVEQFVGRIRRVDGRAFVHPAGHVEVHRRDGHSAIVVPVIGAVESLSVEDAEIAHAGQAAEVRVLYWARGLHRRRTQHLHWLDRHLPIKLLELEGVQQWLGAR